MTVGISLSNSFDICNLDLEIAYNNPISLSSISKLRLLILEGFLVSTLFSSSFKGVPAYFASAIFVVEWSICNDYDLAYIYYCR